MSQVYPIVDSPIGECSICKGMKFLWDDVSQALIPCACYRDEMQRRRQARIDQASGLVGTLRDRSFDAYRANSAPQRTALAAARQFADDPQGWLVLVGANGAGKTHLAAAIANARIAAGQPALFVVVADLLDYFRQAFDPRNGGDTYSDRFEMTRDHPLLILDDLGAEKQTDWAEEKLFQIVNHRYNARLPLVITSNVIVSVWPARLRARVQDKTISRIIAVDRADPDQQTVQQTFIDQEVSQLAREMSF